VFVPFFPPGAADGVERPGAVAAIHAAARSRRSRPGCAPGGAPRARPGRSRALGPAPRLLCHR
jgi:hypothetical protein